MSLTIPERYELKYALSPETARRIRERIGPFCRLDTHSEKAATHEYVITSVYLDTPNWLLYRASREGHPERIKARVRSYGGTRHPPVVFLEIKRKCRGFVTKSRAKIPGANFLERMEDLDSNETEAERAFKTFVAYHGLRPRVLVRYEREAWLSTIDAYARVTFDRNITVQRAADYDLFGDPSGWLPIDDSTTLPEPTGVLLELKSTFDVPRWMVDLADVLDLHRIGFSKYCNGVERLFGFARARAFLGRTPRFA